MLKLLIGKEIRGHVLSYRFLLTLVLFFVLIVSSVQLIALNYDRQLANYSEAKRAQEEKLKEGTDFRRLMWGGTKVDRRLFESGVAFYRLLAGQRAVDQLVERDSL
jgi:hypothetical protein